MTATENAPITDYETVDFNHIPDGVERLVGEGMAQFDVVRERYPDFFRSSAFGHDFWVLTNCEIQRDAYQRPDLFSSRAVSVHDPNPDYLWIPEHLDPPVHTKWRQHLSPFFSPRRIGEMEDAVRQVCIDLIEEIAPRGQCDYITDFSQKYPAAIFLSIMGVPMDQLQQFMQWEDDILHVPATDEGVAIQAKAMNDVVAMFAEILADRRRNPGGTDLVSQSITWEIDGQKIPDDELLSLYLLLFMAGLDTVTNELAYGTWHLATHPEDRRRIVDDPGLIPSAIEEFLRYYAIVMPGRKVTQDVVHHGCPMKAGDMVLMPLAAATRDPAEFPDADTVLIDREPNNHIAFGSGPHRCLGSHLARREMRLALEEWHKRIPDYRVAEGAVIGEYVGIQLGMKNLPLVWDT